MDAALAEAAALPSGDASLDAGLSTSDAAASADAAAASGVLEAGQDAAMADAAALDCAPGDMAAAGLCWQVTSVGQNLGWDDARAFCAALPREGARGFSLPSLDQLRALVRDCSQTKPNGTCPAHGDALSSAATPDCQSCFPLEAGRCYWQLQSLPCDTFFWSSSNVPDSAGDGAWFMGFRDASVNWESKGERFAALCVERE